MGLLRMCTVLRYRNYFRLGFMTYVLLVLMLLVIWTYTDRAGQGLIEHLHIYSEDITANYNILTVKGRQRDSLTTARVFFHKEYPSNHSHPIKSAPPLADVPVKMRPLEGPCSKPRMVEFFNEKMILSGDPLCSWLESSTTMADGSFVNYGNKMALLYDVVVDPDARQGNAKGGERMEEVWGQDEMSEYMALKDGFFTLKCKSKPNPVYDHRYQLRQWIEAVQCVDNVTTFFQLRAKSAASPSLVSGGAPSRVRGLTIAVQRYEYVNLYHTMTDFFNAFLAMLMFNQHPDDVTVLWVDTHPRGGLDEVWETLFGKVMRAGQITSKVRFDAMAWAAVGYTSPLNEHGRPTVSYLDEFRHFFLSRHGVDSGANARANCTSLNVLFVWRRDYAAHPRNKGGVISRKIDNEDELLEAARKVLAPGDRLQGIQLDALPMKRQLELVAATDILVGMHGAGLSHTLFLPPHAGLVELYPTYWPQSNRHFRAMAGWRGLHYQTWQNVNSANEKANKRTYIPPKVVMRMLKETRVNICG